MPTSSISWTVAWNPFDAQAHRLARGHFDVEVVIPGIPVLPPTVERLLAVDEQLEVVADVELEAVHAAHVRHHRALPHHRLAFDILRLGARARYLLRIEQLLRPIRQVLDVLIVDIVLDALQPLLAVDE